MRRSDSLPSIDDQRVIRFCESIYPGMKPFYVPVQPEPGFWPLQCFSNVSKKIEMSDGEAVRGREISQLPRVYLEARFHAVWRSPSGRYVDVTPEEARQSRVLFLPDARHNSSDPPVQLHRFLLAKDQAEAQRYLKLTDELIGLVNSNALGGIQASDPAIQRHISNLQAESKVIRKKLQNDTV